MKLKIILIFSLLSLLTACEPTVNNNYYYPAGRPGLHPSMSSVYQAEVRCRITCFSYNGKRALYPLSTNALPAGSKPIYVKGGVMVPGKYDTQRICRPFGYEKADISALPEFKDVCKVFVNACRDGSCWAGGN